MVLERGWCPVKQFSNESNVKDDTDDLSVDNPSNTDERDDDSPWLDSQVEKDGNESYQGERLGPLDVGNASSRSDEISLDDRLADAERLAQEFQDKYLRSLAELENFRKRALRERADILRYAGEGLARDILEVADTLELALGRSSSGDLSIADGVKLIADRLSKILESHAIYSKSCKGEMFNPEYLEALATVPTDVQPAGTVIEELRKAYFFKDKLLRAGQVVVAAEMAQPTADNQ